MLYIGEEEGALKECLDCLNRGKPVLITESGLRKKCELDKKFSAAFSVFMFLPKAERGLVYGRAVTGVKAQPQNKQIGVAFKADKFLSLVYLLQRLRNSCGSGLKARGAGFITDLMKFVMLKLIRFELNIFSFSGLERMLFQREYLRYLNTQSLIPEKISGCTVSRVT